MQGFTAIVRGGVMTREEKKMIQTRLSEVLRLNDRRKHKEIDEAVRQLKDDIARPDKKYYGINQTTWNTTNR